MTTIRKGQSAVVHNFRALAESLGRLEKLSRDKEFEQMEFCHKEGLETELAERKKAYDGGNCRYCGKSFRAHESVIGNNLLVVKTFIPSCRCVPWCKLCKKWPLLELSAGLIKVKTLETGMRVCECPGCGEDSFIQMPKGWEAVSRKEHFYNIAERCKQKEEAKNNKQKKPWEK